MPSPFNIYEDFGVESYSIRSGLGQRDWIVYGRMFEEILKQYSISTELLHRAEAVYAEIVTYLNGELEDQEIAFSFYPQGSLAQKTTVKNSSSNRFDLDLIARRDIDSRYLEPLQLLELVEKTLKRHPVYGEKLECKNRCVMLPLPGEEFTVDITPGIPTNNIFANETTVPLIVGDRKEGSKPSNPKGFTHWLAKRAELQPAFTMAFNRQMLSDSASAESSEPIPDQDKSLEDVLRRTIQLLKLHRNAYYRKQENFESRRFQPISILISTLAAHAYEKNHSNPALSRMELLLEVIDSMPLFIEKENGKYAVNNPTVEGENFADKWNEEKTGRLRRQAFINWHRQVCGDIRTLLTSQDKQSIREALKKAFGEFGASLASLLIAAMDIEAHASGPGDSLLQRLNPVEPSRTYNAPRETNHA